MAEPEGPLLGLRGLSPVIHAFASLLEAAQVRGVLIGAAAVGMVSQARLTRDIDGMVLLDIDRLPAFLGQAARLGIVPRVPNVLKLAQKTRVMLLRHDPTGVAIDISLGALPFEQEAVERAGRLMILGTKVPVASPEDLVIMKSVAGRSKDYADIGLILEANPKVDLRRIRRWVAQFAEVLEMPEISERLETHLVLRPRKKKTRGKKK